MTKKKTILSAALLLIALFAGGCLVSGTFVIIQSFEFTTQSGYYIEPINLENNEDWEEHRDKLDKVDIVGFELWITNNEPTEWKFWAYMDEHDDSCYNDLDPSCAENSTTKFLVFDTLTIPAGTSSGSSKYVSYSESFNYIRNLDRIKQLVFEGKFNYYGRAIGGFTGNGGKVDSVRVIITVDASDT